MKLQKIVGNIEGVPFVLLSKADLPKWKGFYIEDNSDPQYPDLLANCIKYKMYEGDDFENPKTHWGMIINKNLHSNSSPLEMNIDDFEVVILDPTYYTAWESYDFWIVSYNDLYYFILSPDSSLEINERFLENIHNKFEIVSSIQTSFKHSELRILASTEHGLDTENRIFYDITVIPGEYNMDFWLDKSDFHRVAVYCMKQIKINH